MTYDELKKYIQTASRDEYGYHETNDCNCLHIYNGRRVVNICIGKPNDSIPIANIGFTVDNTATLIPVINGISQTHLQTVHELSEEVGGYYGLVLNSIINTV